MATGLERGYQIYTESSAFAGSQGRKMQMSATADRRKRKTPSASNSGFNSREREDTTKTATQEISAVYEKSSPALVSQPIYTIGKSPKAEREQLLEHMKKQDDLHQKQFIQIVEKTFAGQLDAFGKANSNSIWRMLASGDFTVKPEVRIMAQADIGDDGYWGIEQTSARLFDFASTLAGDDVVKMKDMQKAMEKGYENAIKTWGSELPKLCQDTMAAARRKFNDYYTAKGDSVSLA